MRSAGAWIGGWLAWCWLVASGPGCAAATQEGTAAVRGKVAVRHVDLLDTAHGVAFRAMRADDTGATRDVLTIGLGDRPVDLERVRAWLRDQGYWRGSPGQASLLLECTPEGTPTWMVIDQGDRISEVDLKLLDFGIAITDGRVRGHIRSRRPEEFPAAASHRIDVSFDLHLLDLR